MADSVRQRYERLQLESLLEQHGGLRIVPFGGEDLILVGRLGFHVSGPTGEVIEDQYEVELRVHEGFPLILPTVREIGGRIPKTFHKLSGDLLCLGAPTKIRLKLTLSPTIPAFVNGFVIPYLYGYSFYLKHGRMPYGELPHGDEGIRANLAEIFGAVKIEHSEEFLRLAGMNKRDANKKPCPCGSGQRLGRCHNRRVNELRSQVGRAWFRDEHNRVMNDLLVLEARSAPGSQLRTIVF